MSRAEPVRARHADARGERFTAAMAAIVRRLPFGLAEIVPPSLLGFAVINSCTFAVDLGLLTALHGGLHWPLPVSITVAYITAFGLSYPAQPHFEFPLSWGLRPAGCRVYGRGH